MDIRMTLIKSILTLLCMVFVVLIVGCATPSDEVPTNTTVASTESKDAAPLPTEGESADENTQSVTQAVTDANTEPEDTVNPEPEDTVNTPVEAATEAETVDLTNVMSSPKLLYFYTDSSTHTPESTQNVQIFADHVLCTDAIEVTIVLSYEVPNCNCLTSIVPGMTAEEVDDIRHNHNAHMKETHVQHNQQFIRDTSFTSDATDYRLIVSMYSPFVQLRFKTYDVFVNRIREITGLIENDDVSVIRVNVLKESLEE